MSAMQKRFNDLMDRIMDLESMLDAATAENGSLMQRIIDLEDTVAGLKALQTGTFTPLTAADAELGAGEKIIGGTGQ